MLLNIVGMRKLGYVCNMKRHTIRLERKYMKVSIEIDLYELSLKRI
jgi:hypothetical protein